jgi:hypothetical protein
MFDALSDAEGTPLHEDDGYDDAGRPGTSPLTPRHRGGLACVLGVLVVGATVAVVRVIDFGLQGANPWDTGSFERLCERRAGILDAQDEAVEAAELRSRGVARALAATARLPGVSRERPARFTGSAAAGPPAPGRKLLEPIVALQGIHRFFLDAGTTMPYYGTANIQEAVPSSAQLAIFVIHGALRNAIDYFCIGESVLEESQDVLHSFQRKDTLLIVPKFHYDIDDPHDTDLWWNGTKPYGDWRVGAPSDPSSSAALSSYEVYDQMLRSLGSIENYPQLERVIFIGHSAGAQVVERYALVTHLLRLGSSGLPRGKDLPDLPVRFVVANPSSYTYLDRHRWAYTCSSTGCSEPEYNWYDISEGRAGWLMGGRRRAKGYWGTEGLGVPGPAKPFICKTGVWDDWGYGLHYSDLPDEDDPGDERRFTVPYLASHPNISKAVMEFPKRDVRFLVGKNDTCTDDLFPFCDDSCKNRDTIIERPEGYGIYNETTGLTELWNKTCYRNQMDMRCAGMLQGVNRNVRGHLYLRHLEAFYGYPVHSLAVVPDSGHEMHKMFLSPQGQQAIFGI